MKAIETIYKSYRFRSRLEARWAMFYDCLDLKWQYEPEGFDLDGINYLPDFHIDGLGYVEIKPESPTEAENKKAERLAYCTQKKVFIFFGNIPHIEQVGDPLPFEPDESAHVFYPAGTWDSCQWWCRCLICGKYGVEFEGRSNRICRHADDDKGYNAGDARIAHAYTLARMFRFGFIGLDRHR